MTRVARQGFGSIYVQRGNLRVGLILGSSIFGGFVLLTTLRLLGQGRPLATVVPLIPWILVFIFANGAMEELLFRGIFLKRMRPVLGANLSNILTATVFAVAHMQVGYTADTLPFVAIVFFLGLGLGSVMQKTDSLIAPVLFHAGADAAFMIEIFESMGVTV